MSAADVDRRSRWGGDFHTRRATRLLLDYGIEWLPRDHPLWTKSLVGMTRADVRREAFAAIPLWATS